MRPGNNHQPSQLPATDSITPENLSAAEPGEGIKDPQLHAVVVALHPPPLNFQCVLQSSCTHILVHVQATIMHVVF